MHGQMSTTAAADVARKPKGHLSPEAREAIVEFLRRRENQVSTIDMLTKEWNKSQEHTPQFQLSADRIADIMKEEGIRDETWKQSPVGQKTIRAIRKQMGIKQRQLRDEEIQKRRTAQRLRFEEMKSNPDLSKELREILCPVCQQPCFNTPDFFPVDHTTKKICPRRCIICRDLRRCAYDRSKKDGGSRELLRVRKKTDYRQGVDGDSKLRRSRLDASGDRLLKAAPNIESRLCVGCRKRRPLRIPYFLRIGSKDGRHTHSMICSPCQSDFDRLISRAKADGKSASVLRAIKKQRKELIVQAWNQERQEKRERALKKVAKWHGKLEWCPACDKYLPLTDEYFFTYTLVRTGRKGEISRLRLNCRFCQADIDATRRKERKKR